MNIRQQILENILTEGIHLFAFVKDEDGNNKIIEDSDYPDKNSFKKDLQANGYTVRRINDEKDMYIMDHSDYRSVNELTNKIKQIEKDMKDGIALPSEKIELSNLKELLNKVMEESLNEKASIDWNNYLTSEEIKKFLNKPDVDSIGEIIYDKSFKDRLENFKKSDWTDEELIDDLLSFYWNGHLLTEKEHRPSSYEFWQQQIDNMSEEQLKNYISKLYKQYREFDDNKDTNIPPNKYKDLLRKISYIEKKLGYEQYRIGRKLN